MDDRPRLRLLETIPHEEAGQRGLLLADPEGLFQGQVFVPEGLLPVVAAFSGQSSVAEIAQTLSREYAQDVRPDFVARIAAQLREKLCLEGPEVDAQRVAQRQAYLALPARPATSAGSAGYPAESAACRARLDEIVGRPAPGRRVTGLVAPHIDLLRGEAGYRAAYGALAASPPAGHYVVFGTGHRASELPLVPTSKDYDTPLGRVRTDVAFASSLAAALGPGAQEAEILHLNEHSVEFQALFVRHRHEGDGVLLTPILTGHCEDAPGASELGRLLECVAESIRERGTERTLLVAGADLAHLGPFFGDALPVTDAQLAALEEQDRATLAAYAAGDFDGFWRDVAREDNPRRICGAMPMYCVGRLRQLLDLPVRSELLHYGQAVTPDRTQVVSFAALAFYA